VLAVTNTEWLPNDMMRNSQIVDMDFVAGETLDRLAASMAAGYVVVSLLFIVRLSAAATT
jgi:hypothetical protein